MFKIADGRDSFWQWDIDRQVVVDDPDITEVHFCNKTDDCSLVVEVNEVAADTLDGQHFSYRTANVPNILLQNDFPIRVYAYCGDGYTKVEKVFKVISRTKPSDYAYTETEIKSYEYLEGRFNEIVEKGYDDIALAKGVEEYFIENPTRVSDDGEGNVTIHTVEGELDLSDYATKEYVDEELAKIDTSDIDLSLYATKEYVTEAIEAIEIPETDLSGYATEQWVEDKGYLTEHQSLENYAKKSDIPTIPTKVSAFENDKGYLTQHQDISGKADKVHTHKLADITDYKAPDLSGYALKSEIPTNYLTAIPAEYITETELAAEGFLKEHQSLADYALKSEIPTDYAKAEDIPDVSGYQTEAQVKALITAELGKIGVAEGGSY